MTKRQHLENIAMDALRRTVAEHAIPNIDRVDHIDPSITQDVADKPDHTAFAIELTGNCYVEARVDVGPKVSGRHHVTVNLLSFRGPSDEVTQSPHTTFEHTIAA